MTKRTEVLVIGSGPGGYLAALRAAQLGKQVTVVEKERVGGVCLNVGCIPSKALISAAKLVDKIQGAAELGITVEGLRVDVARLQAWKDGVVRKLTGGVGALLKGRKCDLVVGEARFSDPRSVTVAGPDAPERIEFEHCIIATGSRPIEIPGFPLDGERILDSTGGLALTSVPPRLCVIGGGYIGLELGTAWAKLGARVTVVEMTEGLLPGTDPELTQVVERKLKKKGVALHLRARARGCERTGAGLRIALEAPTGPATVECDAVLVTVGRRPWTDLGLERAGVRRDERGFIPVDEQRRTNVPHVFAIGDVTPGPMLAHKAYREAEVAAEAIAGRASAFDPRSIPAVIFTDPEIAYTGLSEAEARAQGRDVAVGRFPFSASGRALGAHETEGFAKVVLDRQGQVLLGVQIVGPAASELISEASLALEMAATATDLTATIHPHPTLPEAIVEAVRSALGEPLHALK